MSNRKFRLVSLITTLIIMLIPLSVFAEGLFDGGFKEDDDSIGRYIGYSLNVGGDKKIQLNSQIEDLVEEAMGASNVKALTIKKDGAEPLMINVTMEGYVRLKAMARDIYDKQSVKNKVKSMGEKFAVEADIDGTSQALSGFKPIVNKLVGGLAYILLLGMGVLTILDFVYLTMPMFREVADSISKSDNNVLIKETKTGEKKVRWISDEAIYAVKQQSFDTGKHPLMVYIPKRIWAYILVSIGVYMLLSGNIGLFIDIAINVVGGVIDSLSELGK